MTADEIRNWPITDAGLAMHEPHRVAIDSAEFLREIAAQLAESNESRKPRWVNIPSEAGPRLIDATQVVALSCGYISNGMAAPTAAVYVRIKGIAEPLIVTEYDHDEVRFKLGIDEDWMQPPRPVYGRHVSEAGYAEMMEIIDTARKLVEDNPLVSTSTGSARENFTKLERLFDSFDRLPF